MADIIVAGNTSGAITISAPLVAGSGVLTLPVIAADTLAGIAATQTLTNKTLTSPVLTTPALGTPASGVLTNCTGVPAGALPAGSVLQVVNATYATQTSNSTQTLADTGLTATITPTSANSKILVLVNQSGNEKSADNLSNALAISLLRGATIILVDFANYVGYTGAASRLILGSSSASYLDSPATTSATTYKTQFKNLSTSAAAIVQAQSARSTITLMEIAG